MSEKAAIAAAKRMDWTQVVANGGPPCFHLETSGAYKGRFCGRAERWHDADTDRMFHRYKPLHKLLEELTK